MDVQIQKIAWSEMPTRTLQGPVAQPEYAAVAALEVDEAIKFPCRWRHAGTGGSNCSGVLNTYVIGRRKGMKFQSTCKGGVVYVGRIQ